MKETGQLTLRSLGDGEMDGRPAYRLSLLCHADQAAGYYAKRAAIWIDKAQHLPTRLLVYNINFANSIHCDGISLTLVFPFRGNKIQNINIG